MNVIQMSLVDTMCAPDVTDTKIGVAVTTVRLPDGRNVVEFGWGGATSTMFFVSMDLGLSAVALTQVLPPSAHDTRARLKDVVYASAAPAPRARY